MNNVRKLVLVLTTLTLASGCRRSGPPSNSAAHPNVLLVTIDTLRADRVGAYGYAGAETPVMDGLGRRGARFENALASQDLTPRQQQALEKERDRFHSLFSRYEAAYMDGADSAKMDKLEGMQKLLANFSKSVNHIVSGGEPAPTTDTSTAKSAQPQGRVAARGPDGVDLVG